MKILAYLFAMCCVGLGVFFLLCSSTLDKELIPVFLVGIFLVSFGTCMWPRS